VAFVVQAGSGVFLAMFYVASIDVAFAAVEYVMRDVNSGVSLMTLSISRAVPSKWLGVSLMTLSISLLWALPLLACNSVGTSGLQPV
jgi:quinol-cytochrome oxidoreductase complex cytochrome b subunit